MCQDENEMSGYRNKFIQAFAEENWITVHTLLNILFKKTSRRMVVVQTVKGLLISINYPNPFPDYVTIQWALFVKILPLSHIPLQIYTSIIGIIFSSGLFWGQIYNQYSAVFEPWPGIGKMSKLLFFGQSFKTICFSCVI